MLSNVTLARPPSFRCRSRTASITGERIAFRVLADKPREFIWQAGGEVRQVNPPCDEDSKVRTHEEDTDD